MAGGAPAKPPAENGEAVKMEDSEEEKPELPAVSGSVDWYASCRSFGGVIGA